VSDDGHALFNHMCLQRRTNTGKYLERPTKYVLVCLKRPISAKKSPVCLCVALFDEFERVLLCLVNSQRKKMGYLS